jgi:hypothetical protein
VFPLFAIAMMQMHWEVMTLVLIEVMTEKRQRQHRATIVAMGTMWINYHLVN